MCWAGQGGGSATVFACLQYSYADTLLHCSADKLACFAVVVCAGLTKVPIDGQPPSIVQDLEDMCRQYIKVQQAGCRHRGPAVGGGQAQPASIACQAARCAHAVTGSAEARARCSSQL
jgi:hypothetical protein